ncbi:MAG: MipA/OmpV family protein [Deltaproteobacteria bacterium]|jgi:outer membrane protein|nr:MipA/OmpV family protein [Deltaproteobacteria bacterium]
MHQLEQCSEQNLAQVCRHGWLRAKVLLLVGALVAFGQARLAFANEFPEAQPEPLPPSRPLWQFGFGGGGGVTPHYPASNQSSLRFLAVPTFRYRGRVLRSDDDGTRARLIRFEDTEIDLSGAASFPVSSSENAARIGMPELDWIGEVGPRAGVRWRVRSGGANRGDLLKLLFPIRAVFSSDGESIRHRGFVFQPEISLERILSRSNILDSEISLEIDSSVTVINEGLADYFFGVAPEFTNGTRNQYRALSGPLSISTGLILSVSPRHGRTAGSSFFVGIRNTSTGVSVNRESPLHKADQTLSFFTGINIYWFNSDDREQDN